MKPNPPASPETPDPVKSPGLFKRLAKALLIFTVVLAVLITVLIKTVDMDTLREPITTAISEASGLDVSIGALNLEWSSGLGLRADEVSVYSQKGKRTLFSSESLFLKVKWAPLLDRQVEVEEAVIRKPVFLIQPQPDSPVAGAPSLDKNDTSPLTTGQVGLAPMKRLLMGLHLNAETVKVEDAEILWFPTDDPSIEPLQVHASLILKVNRPDEKRLDLEIHQLDLSSGGLNISGDVLARDVLSPNGQFKVQLTGQPFELQTLAGFLNYLPEQAKNLWQQFDPAGEVSAWNFDAGAEDINLFDESSLSGKAMKAGVTFAVNNLVLQPPADRPELRQGFTFIKGSANWNNQKLAHELAGEMRNLPFTVKGSIDFSGAPKLHTVVRVSKARANLLNEWMPRDWTVEQGTMSHRINIRGPVNRPHLFQVDGVVEGEGWLIGFKRDPHFKIPLTSIKGGWRLKNDKLILSSLEFVPPHGNIKSKGNYSTTDRSWRVSYQGDGLRVEDFYQQNVDGDFSTRGALVGRLPESGSPLKTVSGDINFKATAGRFYQLEPLRALLTLLNPLSVTQLNNKGLGYDSFGGDFKVVKGRATTRNLALLSPEMKIYLTGWADQTVNRIEMQGRFQPSQTIDKIVKAVPILGDILTGGKKGGVIETRFKISGPLKRPKVTIDAKGSLVGKGGDMLRELGRLPGKFSR